MKRKLKMLLHKLVLFCNGLLLKFSLGVGFERVFIFSVTLDTRKNERQMHNL
jgi:hypothetical protein